MKLNLETKKIKRVVNKINNIVLDFDPISENTGIYIESYPNKITFKGKNKNIDIKAEIDLDNEEVGSFLIKSKTLNEAINKIEDDVIEIVKNKNNSINLNTESIEFKLNLLNGTYSFYPEVLNKYQKIFTISGEELKKKIKSILFCASEKNPRAILKTINFKIIEKELQIIASDETKIGVNNSEVDVEIKNIEFSISLNIIKDLLKILENKEAEFFINEDKMIILNDNTQIKFNILEMAYPNVVKFIPKQFKNRIEISKDEILKVFNQAMLISTIKSIDETPIKFSLKKSEIILRTQDEGIGNVTVKTKNFTTNISEEFSILFNPKFLVESVKNIESMEIEILFNTYDDPFLIKGANGNHRFLILPFGRG